jgi:amidase
MSYTIHCTHRHFVWDNSIAPVKKVAPGESVRFEIMDAWDGLLTPQSTVDDIIKGNPGRVNPVTGPVYIDGA